jgi:hypothetical protein
MFKLKRLFSAIYVLITLAACSKTTSQAPTQSAKSLEVSPAGLRLAKAAVLGEMEDYLQAGKAKGSTVDWKQVSNVETNMTARRLAAEYSANEVAADNKYKGKRVAVTGVVTQISKDIADEIFIVLSTGDNPFEGVQAYLGKGTATEAAKLSKGQKVGLVCSVDGMMVGHVVLRDCIGQRTFMDTLKKEIESDVDKIFSGEQVSIPQLDQIKAVAFYGYLAGARDNDHACDGHNADACGKLFLTVSEDIKNSHLSEQEMKVAKNIRLDLGMIHMK